MCCLKCFIIWLVKVVKVAVWEIWNECWVVVNIDHWYSSAIIRHLIWSTFIHIFFVLKSKNCKRAKERQPTCMDRWHRPNCLVLVSWLWVSPDNMAPGCLWAHPNLFVGDENILFRKAEMLSWHLVWFLQWHGTLCSQQVCSLMYVIVMCYNTLWRTLKCCIGVRSHLQWFVTPLDRTCWDNRTKLPLVCYFHCPKYCAWSKPLYLFSNTTA